MIDTMTKNSIAKILQRDSKSLGNLLLKLELLKQWNARLAECLPDQPGITEHCKIVGIDKNALLVIADNPHWVTRFRFFIPDLLEKLRSYPDFKNLRAICCKVNPPQFNQAARNKPRTPLIISEQNAKVLQTAANKIQHAKLRAVIERLAGRVMKDD